MQSAPKSIASIEPYTKDLNGVDSHRDELLQRSLWWSLGIVALIVLAFRIVKLIQDHLRHMATMHLSKSQQSYWAKNQSSWWPKIKKNLLEAPLFRKRHNREIRLSSAINMGTLPSRFHAILLGLYLASNVAYCVILDYKTFNKFATLAQLRGRSGVLAVVNMIALVLLAGRNNPLISLLKVSFDTYNLLHRWMGRMVILEAIVHTLAWLFTELAAAKWKGVIYKVSNDPFIGWGTVATFAMILLLWTSPSAIRHAFYETFLTLHIIFAFVAFLGIWIHCDLAKLSQLLYIQVVFALWLADRLFRVGRIIWCNYSRKGWTQASIECLPGDACRVTLHLPKHVSIKPGSHAYLRFGGVNVWESHPFSIGWTEEKFIDSVLPSSEKTDLHKPKTTTDVSFIIHAQTGLTRKLFNKANLCVPRTLTMRAALEGPYGGENSLSSYGHVVLFAGSSGITHQIPFVRQLIAGAVDGVVATRKITLVWIVRDLEHLEWVRPWMDAILQMPGRREILVVKLFITRPRSPREISSPSTTVQMFPGRPNVKLIIENEVREQVGAMCVTVCGPGGLADNVREAVRGVQEVGNIDFNEESFTW